MVHVVDMVYLLGINRRRFLNTFKVFRYIDGTHSKVINDNT